MSHFLIYDTKLKLLNSIQYFKTDVAADVDTTT